MRLYKLNTLSLLSAATANSKKCPNYKIGFVIFLLRSVTNADFQLQRMREVYNLILKHYDLVIRLFNIIVHYMNELALRALCEQECVQR